MLFLVGGFVMYLLGAGIAYYGGARINWQSLLWGQLIVTATQLMVHYANDYFDLAADHANQTPTRWSGGSRVLPEGHLPPCVARTAAIVLGLIALAGTLLLPLTLRPGPLAVPLAVPLLLLGIALSWAYSAPPMQLHSRGVGELTAVAVVTVLTPLAGFYLQTGQLTPLLVLAILPLWFLQFNMLVSVELPDAEGDAASGKYNLVARLGRASAVRLYLMALVAAYLALLPLVRAGLPPVVAAAVALGSPVAAWQGWRVWRGAWLRPAQWGSIAFTSIVLLVGSAALELLAFIALTFPRMP